MRKTISILIVVCVSVFAQDKFIYSAGSAPECAPRDLPAVGVRHDTGQAVLGLHGASASVQAACGWYRVIPAADKLGSNQYVFARSYVLGRAGFQEVLVVSNRMSRTISPEARIAQAFSALPASMTDDERCTAIVQAVAQAITNKLSSVITITIPAAKAVKEVPPAR